ncbi:MAG: hypothetical protein ACYTXY_16210 [Nostoc sp.]
MQVLPDPHSNDFSGGSNTNWKKESYKLQAGNSNSIRITNSALSVVVIRKKVAHTLRVVAAGI